MSGLETRRPARAKLARAVAEVGGHNKFARRLGVSPQYLYMLLHGTRSPGLPVALRLAVLAHIDPWMWAAPEHHDWRAAQVAA